MTGAATTGRADYILTTPVWDSNTVNNRTNAYFKMEYVPFGLGNSAWSAIAATGNTAPVWVIRNGLNDLPQNDATDFAAWTPSSSGGRSDMLGNYATAPTNGLTAGNVYFNTGDKKWYIYNGSVWEEMAQNAVPNANGAIRVGIVPPGGVAAQGLGVYEDNNPWPIDGVGMTALIALTPAGAGYTAANVTAARNNLNKALTFLDGKGAQGYYGGYTVKLDTQPDLPVLDGKITLGATAAQPAYPGITASSLVIEGTVVIGLPEVEALWAANGSTVSYGANVALFPKARSAAAAATVAPLASEFNAVAKDAAGNTYAVGYQNGTGAFTYGGAVTAQGGYTGRNAVIVKYNSAGAAEWAQSVTGGGHESSFNGVAVSPDGYV
jgi:hypothetical protein